MSSFYIERDDNHPTGLVSVFMKNGEPGYQIETEVAWDYIYERNELKELAAGCSAVCFGSLAQRNKVSRQTIRKFLSDIPKDTIRLYDVNLRQNTLTGEFGYTPEIITFGCNTATVIKANRDELFTIVDLLGMECTAEDSLEGIKKRMGLLLTRFPAQAVVVTSGAQGTIVLGRNGRFILTEPGPVKGAPNPVGAGDACSAGILFGLTLGWDIHTTMELANRMGADVASHPSATPPLSDETLNFAQIQLSRMHLQW